MSPQTKSRTALGFGLWRYALIGAVVAFAGPPIYIHTPEFYGDIQGLDLTTMATIFLILRIFDLAQDPLLGWLVNRYQSRVQSMVIGFGILFAIGMLCLFAPNPPLALPAWFGLSLALVFTGFSGLQILFYATGLEMAESGSLSHARIAAWREATVLLGVSAACIAPVYLIQSFGEKQGYWAYSLLFLGLLTMALVLSRPVWRFASAQFTETSSFWHLLKRKNLRWLMGIGYLNSIATGITSTLFLWYAQDKLGADEWHTGLLLLTFFISAAIAAPFWGNFASRYSAKSALMTGMLLVTPAFFMAAFLGQGDVVWFYVICILSGLALGADMTLLPAMLSDELTRSGAGGSFTFGIWGFITKLSFATGLAMALVLVDWADFNPDADIHSDAALQGLAYTYALVPCLMKLLAVFVVWRSPISRSAI